MIIRHAFLAAPLSACMAVLSSACAEAPTAPGSKAAPVLSALDYRVLASFADAPNMLAMAAYPTSQAFADSGPRP